MATPALSDADITAGLAELNGWEREGDMISKTFKLDSYMAGLAFATAVGTIAEGHDHHPDMEIGWRKVKVSFTTHDAGSKITHKDMAVAKAIEGLGYPKS